MKKMSMLLAMTYGLIGARTLPNFVNDNSAAQFPNRRSKTRIKGRARPAGTKIRRLAANSAIGLRGRVRLANEV